MAIDLRIFVEPQQGATYDQQVKIAQRSEEQGFSAFFRSDHFARIGGGDPGPGPTDSWVSLGGIARETSTIRLGTLLTSATFRHPGALSIAVTQVDQMSGGRVEFGLGAGWFEAEHRFYGIPFPSLAERFERLEEQLSIFQGIWSVPIDETFSFHGRHYHLDGAPSVPRPVQQPHPPIIVGGMGARKTLSLAARFAQEYNAPFASVERCAEQFAAFDVVARSLGRDPAQVVKSTALTTCVSARSDLLEQRLAKVGRSLDDANDDALVGSGAQVVERLRRYEQAGIERVYLQIFDIDDLDHVSEIGETVLRHF
jgi:F420-dependent oxidoreductase-like protein